MEQMNMSKIASLQAGLNRAAASRHPVAASDGEPTPSPVVAASASPATAKATSREGKVHVGAYLPAGFKSSLRLVQAQTGEDTQTLLARALNDLFRGHNVPVIDQE
jgi:hypothetical protein